MISTLSAVLLCLAFMPLGGCLNPCSGALWGTSFGWWHQPGVFDRFPTEGERAGYRIEWHTPSDDPHIIKSDKYAEKPHSEGGSTGLSADESGDVYWSLTRHQKLSKDAVWSELNRTFDDLMLPRPEPANHEVRWGKEGC